MRIFPGAQVEKLKAPRQRQRVGRSHSLSHLRRVIGAVSDSGKDHGPEARNSAAFAISVFTRSIAKLQVERMEKRVTFWDTIATRRVHLSDLVGIATLAGTLEDWSRHACLNKSWTKGVDPDVGALELPCGRLRD